MCKWFESTDSTNVRCQELWQKNPRNRYLIIADAQTQGRGRYGHIWQSAPGVNIYLSLVWENAFASAMGHLNLFWGLMIREALYALYPTLENKLTLKWPNDVYIGTKKLAGILIQNLDQTFKQLVVGVGIDTYAAPKQIPPSATSLRSEIGKLECCARANIITRLLKNVGDFTTIYRQCPQLVIEKFARYSRLTREFCYRYSYGNREIEGKLREVFSDGTIEIVTTDGKILHLTN